MSVFNPSSFTHGHTPLGLYGAKTPLETPGPGSYDPFPLLNPPAFRTTRHTAMPDRAPGYRNLKTMGAQPWRPEPMSLSRLQSEQPLINYASATFWDWPTQRRKTGGMSSSRAADGKRRGSQGSFGDGAGASWADETGGRRPSLPIVGASRSQPSLAQQRGAF
mmetsp:Transcript_74796/g.217119  ORF Transcript_74796/g.217119 Transcript_74796/m.217119 type:complete len:163 (+) Transcript_74796:91-579(+)